MNLQRGCYSRLPLPLECEGASYGRSSLSTGCEGPATVGRRYPRDAKGQLGRSPLSTGCEGASYSRLPLFPGCEGPATAGRRFPWNAKGQLRSDCNLWKAAKGIAPVNERHALISSAFNSPLSPRRPLCWQSLRFCGTACSGPKRPVRLREPYPRTLFAHLLRTST